MAMIVNKKNKRSLSAGRQGGFLQLIILIIIALFLLKYFQLSVSDVVDWFKATF